jgi:uncharacterized protein (DUF362 family)
MTHGTDPRRSRQSTLEHAESNVAIAWGPEGYTAPPPYSPGTAWPEYQRILANPGASPNPVYDTVRESLRLLGLDAGGYSSVEWNPLGQWIRPGDTVVLKPNFVRDFRESSPDDADCLIAHGSVIRAVLDYAYLALEGRGRLVIADAPQNDADFDRIRQITHLGTMVQFYRQDLGFQVEVYDLRPEAAVKIDGVIVDHRPLAGDPAGYVAVDLGALSAFTEIGHLCHRLYGAEYDRAELVRHHADGHHEYPISKTVLDADCVISIPKLKTHKKTGLTANLKNVVGINGNKNWLPHHREGTPAEGGDQFADSALRRRFEGAIMPLFRRCFTLLGPLRGWVARPIKSLGTDIFGDTNSDTVRSGNWFGNDTTWRMVLDLNRILRYVDAEGSLHHTPVRSFFSVVDGIIAGEGNGPLDATPRPSGLVLAGPNPVAVDTACAADGVRLRQDPVAPNALSMTIRCPSHPFASRTSSASLTWRRSAVPLPSCAALFSRSRLTSDGRGT